MMRDGAFVMCRRGATAAALAALMLLPAASAGQTEQRTSWGDPDIQGVWDFRTLTPLERPVELGDKEFLTAEEAAEFEAQQLAARDADRRDGAELPFGIGSDVERAYNQFWWDYGTNVIDDRRTSLIIDPADGRIPYTEAGQAEAERFFAVLFGNVAAGPEDRALGERCILGFNSGPPMLPSAYNNNVQLFQTPDTVVILNEMVHNARIVPLDGRPHLPSDVRQWVGDSRGRWEGDSLVVETTNFLGETSFVASTSNLRLVERFTRTADDVLVYEFTVEDPTMWTRPWTAAVPMKRNDLPLFEYACHEGNYGMTNLLSGARVEEAEAAAESGQP
ncbi:MAG: hypothetical protein OXH69_08115 [Acidobacteria bacterium]|nr:hypothetical protein [Acidobacteriota bacterium]